MGNACCSAPNKKPVKDRNLKVPQNLTARPSKMAPIDSNKLVFDPKSVTADELDESVR